MLEQLLDYDTQLFVFLNALGNENWDAFWLIVTSKFSFIPLYALLVFLVYKKFGWKKLLLTIVVMAALITFTDQITNVVKRSVLRFRPCACDEIKDMIRFIAERCSRQRSFFSGHASNTMAMAVFVGLLLRPFYKKLLFLLITWSIIVAYSRIYVGVHFPIDVLCGMCFGALTGYSFYRLHKVLLAKYFKA